MMETKKLKPISESKKASSPVEFDSDEDEAAFYDALESMSGSIFIPNKAEKQTQKTPSLTGEETKDQLPEDDDEPLERDMLPWLKDPSVKISIWAILKDNLGKDISKISVPVFFNDPTSLLQKCAQSMEYNDLLDRAGQEPNALKRMALVAVHGISQLTICERTNTKPFNPLLGETYEYVNKDFSFLSE